MGARAERLNLGANARTHNIMICCPRAFRIRCLTNMNADEDAKTKYRQHHLGLTHIAQSTNIYSATASNAFSLPSASTRKLRDEDDQDATEGSADDIEQQEDVAEAAIHALEEAAAEETEAVLQSMDSQAQEATQPLTTANLKQFDKDHNGYAAALSGGYHVLVRKLWGSEKPLRQTLANMEFDLFDNLVTKVLATVPTPILREVLAHNLAYAHLKQKKADVVEVVKTYNHQWVLDNVAVVYQITIGGKRGALPTKKKWQSILQVVDFYRDFKATDPDIIQLAFDIDRIGHPKQDFLRNKHGGRRYIPAEDKRAPNMLLPENVRYKHVKPSPERDAKFQTCMDAIRARIEHASDDEPIALTYTGYTNKASRRWKEHDDNPENYLMGAFLSAARYLYPEDEYDLQKYVIAPLASSEEAPIAEIIVCALGDGYYDSGFGLNMADAGESNSSISAIQESQWIKIWNWICKCSPRQINMQNQNAQLQAQIEETTAANAMIESKLRIMKYEAQVKQLEEAEHKMLTLKKELEIELLWEQVERMKRIEQILLQGLAAKE